MPMFRRAILLLIVSKPVRNRPNLQSKSNHHLFKFKVFHKKNITLPSPFQLLISANQQSLKISIRKLFRLKKIRCSSNEQIRKTRPTKNSTTALFLSSKTLNQSANTSLTKENWLPKLLLKNKSISKMEIKKTLHKKCILVSSKKITRPISMANTTRWKKIKGMKSIFR